MHRKGEIWLSNAESTHSCGRSLAATLYSRPITVLLSGELGSGKTTFLKGFSEALGTSHPLQSPTFALEHHYETANGDPFLHIDLYRLSGKEAAALVEQTADFTGIRCIEWAQHVGGKIAEPHIAFLIEDPRHRYERKVSVEFRDMPLPTEEQIDSWRQEVALPEHIARHCDAVAAVAVELGKALLSSGHLVRLHALHTAGRTHDLLRFVDFGPGGSHVPGAADAVSEKAWAQWKARYAGKRHEAACAAFLAERGFPALGSIVETHGLRLPPRERRTIEQQLLYYADKRVKLDEVVTLDERFADFASRYAEGPHKDEGRIWYDQAKTLEEELFGGAPPL